MFIQTEQTPNPASLKFLPGCEVMLAGTAEFISPATASAASPLAFALFRVAGVKGVFLGRDFITVTKADEAAWPALKPLILGVVMEHFTAGRPVMNDEHLAQLRDKPPASTRDDDDEIVKQIKEILDTRIRPAVAADGGDIEFDSFTDGVVYLRMRGACAGCPSSTATLKMGIENLLRHFIPEVNEVQAVN
jgi:Fe-S cluster biogenesis protein NfuA